MDTKDSIGLIMYDCGFIKEWDLAIRNFMPSIIYKKDHKCVKDAGKYLPTSEFCCIDQVASKKRLNIRMFSYYIYEKDKLGYN